MDMQKIKAYFRLMRPLNCLIAGVSVFIGGVITGSVESVQNLILAVVSAMLICAGGNSINDYFDIDIDIVNKPFRPLPSGILSATQALIFSLSLFISGFIVSFFINVTCIIIAGITSVLLYLYSSKLKRTVLFGNAAVAFISGLAFVYGGVAVGNISKALIVGIFALLYHFAREIIKDIEDTKGDSYVGSRSFPILYGDTAALLLTSMILILLIGITIIPYLLDIFSLYYLIIVVAGVDMFLIYAMVSMWRNSSVSNLRRLEVMMKINMLMGLLAVYVGR
ncbi:MAG: UbiA family prenyltransferase [bacterium]